MIYFIKIQWLKWDTLNLLITNSLLMILLFNQENAWKVLYISKSDSQRRGPKAPQCHNITVTEPWCWLNVMELSRNIWSVQLYNMYSIKPPEWGQVDSEAPHTMQINLIFSIPAVQEEKSCSYWVSDRKQNENHIMRDRGVPKAPFWEEQKRWSCQEHTATEDWTQSEILVPIAVCSVVHSCRQLSTSMAG